MATVTNTIKLPDGSAPTTAAVEIELVASTTSRAAGWNTVNSRTILSIARPTVTAGVWTASLEPNANIDPAGTVYKVTEYADRHRYIHYISVGAEGGSVYDLLVESPTAIESPPVRVASIVHGNDPTVARLDTTAVVLWVGEARPDDIAPGDVWVQSPWLPTDDTTLELWLDASKRSSVINTSGAVSQWSDLSGNGRHAANATSGAQPTTGTVTLNGLNALSFDGGDYLICSSIATATERTFYAVVAANTNDQTRRVIAESSGGGTFTYAQVQLEVSASDFLTTITATSGGTTRTSAATTAFPELDPVVAIMTRDTAFQYIYENTTLKDVDTLPGTLDTSATALVIGKQREPTAARYWKGLICEVLDFSSHHTAAQRGVVCNYLATKWGITL